MCTWPSHHNQGPGRFSPEGGELRCLLTARLGAESFAPYEPIMRRGAEARIRGGIRIAAETRSEKSRLGSAKGSRPVLTPDRRQFL